MPVGKKCLQVRNANLSAVKHARRQRAVDGRQVEYIGKMLHAAGPPRRNQRDTAVFAYRRKLRAVITLPHTVLVHAVQHDLARAAFLCFDDPGDRVPRCGRHLAGIAGISVDLVLAVPLVAVYSEHHTLGSEAACQAGDELRVLESGGIHGNLVSTLVEHIFGIRDRAYAAGNAERNVQYRGDATDPGPVDCSSVRACRDVVEDQLVRVVGTVAFGEPDDIADDTMVSKTNALYDLAVADIQAGNYALCRNDSISCRVIFPSSSALPVMAESAPSARSV